MRGQRFSVETMPREAPPVLGPALGDARLAEGERFGGRLYQQARLLEDFVLLGGVLLPDADLRYVHRMRTLRQSAEQLDVRMGVMLLEKRTPLPQRRVLLLLIAEQLHADQLFPAPGLRIV